MATKLKVTIILRHDTTEGWKAVENTAVLKKGELGLEFTSDSNVPKIKIGDGKKSWKNLEYFTLALPKFYTWGDLRGVSLENETSYTENLGLKKPAYTETVNVVDLNENYDKIERYHSELTNELNLVRSQVDSFVASYPDGIEGSVEWEVQDSRRRYNNATYSSLGAAIRAIDEDLQHLTEQMSEFIGSSAIDGLHYEGNKLWVASNGVPVGDPVEIVSGSGGGGGGGSSYTISLSNLLDSRILSVEQGKTVILEFNYTSVDNEGYDDGPGIGTLFVSNFKQSTFPVPQGKNTLNVTNYLVNGENTVKIQVANSDGSYRSISYTINVITLSITTTATDMSLYNGNVSMPYTVTGAGSKIVYFFMDGKQIGQETITSSGRTYFFPIPAQEDGGHIFEAYAEVDLGSAIVRSSSLKLGMMWWSDSMSDTAILINNSTTKITQGETLSIPYLVYNHNASENKILLTIIAGNGTVYSEKELTVDRTVKYWNTQDFPVGNTIFQISSGRAIEQVTIETLASSFSREIITSGLLVDFNARGRSNTEEHPENWSYTVTDDFGNEELVEAEFNGFGWANIDGWLEVPVEDTENDYQTALRFMPGNSMSIPYAPFNRQNLKNNGMTIEAEFSTHNVKNSETTIVASYNGKSGLTIQASSAELHSSVNTVVSRFRENSRVRVTFVIEPVTANSFIYAYINGIMCGVAQYTEADEFTHDKIIEIGADSSGLDLYSLRFYNYAFSSEEQLNNFICDRATLAERIAADERNDIFNNDEITIESLPMTIPYIVMECEELPRSKGDKKKDKSVTFVDPINPARSFTATGCEFDVQGTSSADYPKKNYKVKLKKGISYTNSGNVDPDGFPVFEDGISAGVLCLKADYASSENANNVTLVDYYESIAPFDGDIPYPPTIENPEDDGYVGFIDTRCRRGIRGFPIVVFWKNTETGEISFIGKYNLNDDKSNEIVFGFDRDIIPKTECWEFRNNTSDRVLFKDLKFFEGEENATDWSAESTYQTGDIVIHNSRPYKCLEDSVVAEPTSLNTSWEQIPWFLDKNNGGLFGDFEPRFPDLDDMYSDFSGFYRMCRWIHSTDTTVDNSGTDLKISIKGELFADTPANRLRKFKEEFTEYFIKDATLFFYIFTELFLMIDNRAKNMFLTTFDAIHWFPIQYDMDTAIGINNEGQLSFEYNLEDTDIVNEANVYNGQDSVLWNNVREAFSSDLQAMYSALRSDNTKSFNYQTIKDKMANHQSIWPEALWNEDAYLKYIGPYLAGESGKTELNMLQGDKRSQRDWWLYYAFKYRDSKYECADASSSVITLRCYSNDGSLHVTPYSHLYVRVKFGSNTYRQRASRNQECIFTHDGNLNDTETYIYSADCISDIGDLSPFRVGMVNVAAATKLQRLILGSSAEGYRNLTFEGISVGTNELLSEVNIENCLIDYTKHGSAGTINFSNCHGLETVKAKGSNIKSLILPDGGHLKTLELPNTLIGFVIKNQKNFESLTLEGYDKVSTLNLENTPNLPIETLLLNCPLTRLRLRNIEWTVSNEENLQAIFNKLTATNENGNYIINGYNDVGAEVEKAQISGRVYIDSISSELIEAINTIYPELVIVVNGEPKFFIRYNNKDNTKLYSYIADAGTSAPDPITDIDDPISVPVFSKTPDENGEVDTNYIYEGWTYDGISGLPTNIQKPYVIITDYEETYRVRFYKDANLTEKYDIDDQWVSEDGSAFDPLEEGLIETPTQAPTAQYSKVYKDWSNSLKNIRKPLNLYPTFSNVLNSYTVHFMSNGVLLQDPTIVPYGETAIYRGNVADIPYYEAGGYISEAWDFEKWDRSLLIEPTEYTTDPIIITAVFAFVGDLNNISWAEIAQAAKEGNIDKYGIGSTKLLEMTIDGTTIIVEMELIGKNYDVLTTENTEYNKGNGKCAFTFITKECASWKKPFQTSSISTELQPGAFPAVGGWELSTLRQHCINEIYGLYIPSDLKEVIKQVDKISDIGYVDPKNGKEALNTTSDYIWVPSATELNFDSEDTKLKYLQGQSAQGSISYPWFTNNGSRIKNFGSEPSYYWTRTHRNGYSHRMISINSNGEISDSNDGNVYATVPLAVVFGFCI